LIDDPSVRDISNPCFFQSGQSACWWEKRIMTHQTGFLCHAFDLTIYGTVDGQNQIGTGMLLPPRRFVSSPSAVNVEWMKAPVQAHGEPAARTVWS
jgi:hypothetical protein